jgi:polyphosphate glucokinase
MVATRKSKKTPATTKRAGKTPRKPRTVAAAPRLRVVAKRAPTTTLAIDIGGSGLKAAVLDDSGAMLTERVRVDTPQPCDPKQLVEALVALVKPLPRFDRVSVGFPGVIRKGRIYTAPNLGTERFAGFDLGRALEQRLGAPVRAANDADIQGLGVVQGEGVEMVVTLGTGFGTALFVDGRLGPHLEIAHHPFRKGETYDQQIGNAAREAVGNKKWTARVEEAIANLRTVVNFDRLYIGGGNASKLKCALADDCVVVDNSAGITGGVKLWTTSTRKTD